MTIAQIAARFKTCGAMNTISLIMPAKPRRTRLPGTIGFKT